MKRAAHSHAQEEAKKQTRLSLTTPCAPGGTAAKCASLLLSLFSPRRLKKGPSQSRSRTKGRSRSRSFPPSSRCIPTIREEAAKLSCQNAWQCHLLSFSSSSCSSSPSCPRLWPPPRRRAQAALARKAAAGPCGPWGRPAAPRGRCCCRCSSSPCQRGSRSWTNTRSWLSCAPAPFTIRLGRSRRPPQAATMTATTPSSWTMTDTLG
mmetsp:Transcript_39566/g.112211  ORF Transcript_39566/g.112211 Transcript_39566/m.112211 type:complete len:207 (-) Transcript_39566:1455-2075(-)